MLTRKTAIFVIALLVVSSVIASDVYGQAFGRNKIQYKDHEWQVLITPHFEIHFYERSESFAVRAGLCLEDGYQELSEKLNVSLPWRVPIILYSSHNDFLQTNVSLQMLNEGIQAFAEPSRKRIVLPFTGSWPAFSHTANHELAHIFSFRIIYNRMLDNMFSRTAVPGMPLWLMEGLAEYLSVGWDTEADMFVRDGVINDYLGDLNYAYGYANYKQGQSAFNYIEEVYGKEKVLELLDVIAVTRSADAALEKTLGLTVSEFTVQWKKAQRKKYWPMIAEKQEASEIGRRLTDHIKQRAVYNTKPVMSPDGEKIAYITSRGGVISIYLMSALNGKEIRRLVEGHRSGSFESLHFLTSDMAFSPNSERLAFVAKDSGSGRTLLYIMETRKGKILEKYDLGADGLASPAWSPDSDMIAVSAVFAGQTDLIMLNLGNGEHWRLTNDFQDQLNPRFFPDGDRIAFEYFENVTRQPVPKKLDESSRALLSEMDFTAKGLIEKPATLDIWEIDIVTRKQRPLIQTKGDDQNPVPLDGGNKLIFTSDESGISNMYVADLRTGEFHRFTDVLGGVFTPDIIESKGRIAFSGFDRAGWDIYVSDDLYGLMENRYEESVSVAVAQRAQRSAALRRSGGAGIPAATLLSGADTSDEAAEFAVDPLARPDEVYSLADDDSLKYLDAQYRRPDALAITDKTIAPVPADAVPGGPGGPTNVEGLTTGVGFDEPESRGASVANYKLKLAPDYIGQGGGLYFSSTFGFGLANTIAMSDLLGNHRLALSFSIIRNIEDSAIMAQYFYLKKRVNYGIGVYQYKNFINGRLTSIGESFADNRFFSERNYGMYGLISYPLSTFNRWDLRLDAFVTQREFFEEQRDENDLLVFTGGVKSTRHIVEPTLAYVHDSSFFGPYGPVEGSRYSLSYAQGVGVGASGVFRSTAMVDYRKYIKLFHRNTFAFRVAAAGSEGNDPRTFFLGGPTTLRGWDYLTIEGNRMAFMNFEYRFPLLDALILGFPGRWGFGNIQGTLFFDIGNAWYDGGFVALERGPLQKTPVQLRDVKSDFGIGTQFYFGYFLLNFQMAWQTDLHTVQHSQFHFYFGPTF